MKPREWSPAHSLPWDRWRCSASGSVPEHPQNPPQVTGTWAAALWCLLVGFVVFFFSFYAGLYPMKSPSFTLIAVGNMWSLIKNIFSVEIAFISWANFSWPSTHQSFFGKGNSSLWVSKCQATEQKERGRERKKQLTSLLQSICTKSLGRISF